MGDDERWWTDDGGGEPWPPGDDRWYAGDPDGSLSDDQLDDLLRSRIGTDLPTGLDAHRALSDLGPTLVRARRRAMVNRAVVSAAAVALVVGVAGMALQVSTRSQDLDTAGPAPTSGSDTPTDDPAEDGEAVSSLPSPHVEPQGDGPDDGDGDDDPRSDVGTPLSLDSEDGSTTSSATTVTTTPAGDSPPTTTVGYRCGELNLSVDGSSVWLVEAVPAPGARASVKNEGPEQVEVGFEGGGHHCEIVARVGLTGLETSVDNHPEVGVGDGEHDGGGEHDD